MSKQQNKSVAVLLNELKSINWRTRTQAYSKLCRLKNERKVDHLVYYSPVDQDAGLAYSCARVARNWLSRSKIEHVAKALTLLFFLADNKSEEVSRLARKKLEIFLANRHKKHSGAFIAETLRIAWENLGEPSRFFYIELVHENKIQNLAPAVIESLGSDNRELVLLALKATNRLKSVGAKRSLTRLAQSNDERICQLALRALAEVGDFWDAYYIRRLLLSKNTVVLQAAISCYAGLLKSLAVPRLIRMFRQTDEPEVKKQILKIFGRIEHRKAIDFLFEIFLNASDPEIQSTAEWAILESRHEISVVSLIRVFDQSRLDRRFGLMQFMAQPHHERCYQKLASIIRNEKNEFLVISALESIASYRSPATTKLLLEKLATANDQIYASTVSAIINNRQIDQLQFIEEIIRYKNWDNVQTDIVLLKALGGIEFPRGVSETTRNYPKDCLSSSVVDLKFLAAEVVDRIYDLDILRILIEEQAKAHNAVLERALSRAIAVLIVANPFYINYCFEILNHEVILDELSHGSFDLNFIQRLIRYIEKHYRAEVIAPFFSRFEQRLAPLCFEYLVGPHKPGEAETILKLACAEYIRPTCRQMQKIASDTYPLLTQAGKRLFLELCVMYPELVDDDFMVEACFAQENNSDADDRFLADYIGAI